MIDVVGYDAAAGEYLLVMVEERPWDSDPDQAAQLRAKINTYVGFVLDGGLRRHYPETAGQPVRLQLNCTAPLSGEAARIVEHANAKLADTGLRLAVHVWD